MTISMEHDDPTWQFEGFRSPNFTTVPDELFDDLIPRLSGAEVKVLLYIVRRTFGFKKERDNISISQMLEGIVKKMESVSTWGPGWGQADLVPGAGEPRGEEDHHRHPSVRL